MPSRNIVREDTAEAFYHIYARGVAKQTIFLESSDFIYFQKLFARYLSKSTIESKMGYIYPKFYNQMDLLAYCLMNNHFHILVYQKEAGNIKKLMQSIMTSYSRYFNLKYKRTGPLFESRYKASRIDVRSYLEHISRYIHLNPRYWKSYPYSSLKYYLTDQVDWVNTEKILDLFKDKGEYYKFLDDYEEHKMMLKEIKHELAT